jgi:hypothetical protein
MNLYIRFAESLSAWVTKAFASHNRVWLSGVGHADVVAN